MRKFAQTPISVRMPTVGISPARQQTGCAKHDQPPVTSYDDSDQTGGTGGESGDRGSQQHATGVNSGSDQPPRSRGVTASSRVRAAYAVGIVVEIIHSNLRRPARRQHRNDRTPRRENHNDPALAGITLFQHPPEQRADRQVAQSIPRHWRQRRQNGQDSVAAFIATHESRRYSPRHHQCGPVILTPDC